MSTIHIVVCSAVLITKNIIMGYYTELKFDEAVNMANKIADYLNVC